MAPTGEEKLASLWNEAADNYLKQRKAYEDDCEKKHNHHLFHRRKKRVEDETSLTSAEDFKSEIARREAEFSDMRAENRGVFKAMKSLAAPVEIIGGQASAIGGLFFPATPMIFGAVMYLFNAGKDVSENFNVLEELFTTCDKSISAISMMVEGVRELAPELQEIKKRLKAYFEALSRPGKSSDAKSALQHLEDLSKERTATVGIATYATVDRTEAEVQVVKSGVDRTEGKVDILTTVTMEMLTEYRESKHASKETNEVKKEQIEGSRKALRSFLDPMTSNSDRVKEIRNTTTLDTCEWIFAESEFQDWANNTDNPIPCIYGKSGTGKSHLAASIVNHFGPSRLLGGQNTSRASVAAYFCEYNDVDDFDDDLSNETEISSMDENDGNNESVKRILGTMAWQLSEDDTFYKKDLTDHLEATRKRFRESQKLIDVWDALFQNKYLRDIKERFVTLIIDGIENLPRKDRKLFFELLKQAYQSLTANPEIKVKLLILSQPALETELAKIFLEVTIPSISIIAEKNGKDIARFISSFINQSPKLSKALSDEDFRVETIKKLTKTTKGVFEMADLLLKRLAQKDHVDLFSEAINNPPSSISSILRETLLHFGQTHSVEDIIDLNTMLAWVLYARRHPLNLAELNAAIGLESEHGEFLDIKDKIQNDFSAYFSVVELDQIASPKTVRIADLPNKSTGLLPSADQYAIKEWDVAQETLENTKRVIPDDKLSSLITVKVAHASIGKFFRSAGTVSLEEKNVTIGVTRGQAHLKLVKTCLRAICSTEDATKRLRSTNSDSLLNYAATFFHEHLEEAAAAASLQEKTEIANSLIRMFRDERIIERWVRQTMLWPSWFKANGPIRVVLNWLSDGDVRNGLKEEDARWVEEPLPPRTKLLRPITEWCAKNWLLDTDEAIDTAIYFFIFYNAYVKLLDVPEGESGETSLHPLKQALKLTPDGVREVARWVRFDETPLWHTRVAYVLEDISRREDAIEEYKKALEKDPDYGAAHFALATDYGEIEKYDLAISQMEESIRCKFNLEDGADLEGAMWIATWQQARADTEEATDEALRTLDQELEKYPEDYQCIGQYIEIAGSKSRTKSVMSVLRRLGKGLPSFLIQEDDEDVHEYIRRAAQKTKNVTIVKKAYELAINQIQSSKSEQKIIFLVALANLYAENQEEDKAIITLKKILEFWEELSSNDTFWTGLCSLVELHFSGLNNKAGTLEEQQEHLAALIELEKEEHLPDTNAVSSINYSSGLMLGLYYRLENQQDKARPYFKDRIAVAMALLEDDDLENDRTAYEILGNTLRKANDSSNAIAATSLLYVEFQKNISAGEKSKAQLIKEVQSDLGMSNGAELASGDSTAPAKTSDELPAKSAPNREDPANYPDTPCIWGMCDGPCNRDMSKYTKGIHFCTYCMDRWFCDECLPLHLAGDLPYKVCDPAHKLMYTPGPPKDLPDDLVKVDGKMRKRAEWLDEIRKEWGLEVKKQEA